MIPTSVSLFVCYALPSRSQPHSPSVTTRPDPGLRLNSNSVRLQYTNEVSKLILYLAVLRLAVSKEGACPTAFLCAICFGSLPFWFGPHTIPRTSRLATSRISDTFEALTYSVGTNFPHTSSHRTTRRCTLPNLRSIKTVELYYVWMDLALCSVGSLQVPDVVLFDT